MAFVVHQNFLALSQLILGRLPGESSKNLWAHSLFAQVINKKNLLTDGVGFDKNQSSRRSFTTHCTNSNLSPRTLGILNLDEVKMQETKILLPSLQKQNQMLIRMTEKLLRDAKSSAYSTELNQETLVGVQSILGKIYKARPSQCRECLFVFLERFTT